jgi:hypothetical protein
MKGVTRVDNLNWMYNLSSPYIIGTSKPITEENSSLSNKVDIKIAKTLL